MPVNDEKRTELYRAFCDSVGRNVTDTLMEILPPHDWSAIAKNSDVVELRSEVNTLRAEFNEWQIKVDSRFQIIDHDLTRINKTLGWMIGSMVTVGVLIIGLLFNLSSQISGLK